MRPSLALSASTASIRTAEVAQLCKSWKTVASGRCCRRFLRGKACDFRAQPGRSGKGVPLGAMQLRTIGHSLWSACCARREPSAPQRLHHWKSHAVSHAQFRDAGRCRARELQWTVLGAPPDASTIAGSAFPAPWAPPEQRIARCVKPVKLIALRMKRAWNFASHAPTAPLNQRWVKRIVFVTSAVSRIALLF